MVFSGREMRTVIDSSGSTVLSLEEVEIGDPGDDEIIVRVEAAPINPSDLGLMIGPADLSTIRSLDGNRNGAQLSVPRERLAGIAGRLDQSLPVGNEGAGTVVAAGKNAAAMVGKRVAMMGGAMFADYRRGKAQDAIILPDDVTAIEGASLFINPLTALGFVETARREGHKAIVHTAAASNLGQMLQKICTADRIPLVNIVRSQEQVEIMRAVGANYVLNSRDGDFLVKLADAIQETNATIVFDAVGGGTLGSTIMQTMEKCAVMKMPVYSRYGSDLRKHLYAYGALDMSPMVLDRMAFGFRWSVSAWLLFPFLHSVGLDVQRRLQNRVVRELKSTFVSHYSHVIGLAAALDPAMIEAYSRKATGEKYLIDPTKD